MLFPAGEYARVPMQDRRLTVLAVEHVLLDQTEVRWMVLAATEVGDANQLVIDRPAPIAVLVACTACGGGTLCGHRSAHSSVVCLRRCGTFAIVCALPTV